MSAMPCRKRQISRPRLERLEDRTVLNAGDLDPTFSFDGLVTTDLGASDVAEAVAVYPSGTADVGKIIVAGSTSVPTPGSNIVLARYHPDGRLDAGFDQDGLVVTDFGAQFAEARDMVILPDGKILAAGFTGNLVGSDFLLVRYHPDGRLDTTFGINGKVATNFGGFDLANGVVVQPDQKIVVAGTSFQATANYFAVARYHPSGELDTAFGAGGTVLTSFDRNTAMANDVAYHDGAIVVAGSAEAGSGDLISTAIAVARYDANGNLDPSFDTDGRATIDFGPRTTAIAQAVTLQPVPSGTGIVVAGSLRRNNTSDFVLARFQADGSLDQTFGDSVDPNNPQLRRGTLVTDFLGGLDSARDVVVLPGDYLLAAGSAQVVDGATGQVSGDFALARYRPDGVLDTDFGTGGKVTTPFPSVNPPSPSADSAAALHVQENGQVVVAGSSALNLAVARYERTGNTPPTISDLADLAIDEDSATGPIAFTVGDAETSLDSLTVQVFSSSSALVPESGLVLDGQGADRTLHVTPAANEYGAVTITVTVTDADGESVAESFTLTVNPINDAPGFIKGADQTVNEDAGPQLVPGWATAVSPGPSESAQVLTFLVSNDNNALFAVQPSISPAGALTYTPAANAFGRATVTVVLQDDGGTAAGGQATFGPETFVITVNPVNDLPTISAIADQMIRRDTQTDVLSFSVSDVEGPADSLIVTARSSNATLVPDSNILLGLSPRSVSVVPVPGQVGLAAITLTVSDADGASSTETFLVGVHTLRTTFEGIDAEGQIPSTGFLSLPPDPHGAVGPNHVVSVVNMSIEWHTREGVRENSQRLGRFGSPSETEGSIVGSFFEPLNPVESLFDPKVIYDQFAGRFVVVALEIQGAGGRPGGPSSRILVAVSDDSDPNGTWRFLAIDSMTSINGELTWADYPGFAVDEEAVYITANMFTFPGGSGSVGARLWIIDKGLEAGFYANGGGSFSVHDPLDGGPATTLQPAHVFGAAPQGLGTFLVSYGGISDGVNESVQVIRVDNPLTAPTFSRQFVDVGDIDDIFVPALPSAPQSGTTVGINVNDRRALNAVWRNDRLWMTAEVSPPSGPDVGQTTAHWWQLDTTDPSAITVVAQGDVGAESLGPGTFTFFPSIMVDRFGNAGLGFAASNAELYAGAFYAMLPADQTPGSAPPVAPLALGEDTYILLSRGRNRWGDYTGLALDPTDERTFWLFNEYAQPRSAEGDGRWGTRWGSFVLAAPNQPPLARDDHYRVSSAAGQLSIPAPGVLANDSDAEGDPLTAELVSAPGSGTLVLQPDGSFAYTPAAGFVGDATFTYRVFDGVDYSGLATVTIQVVAPPAVESVVINDGGAQRSKVNRITITFSGVVSLAPDAFTLVRQTAAGASAVRLNVAVSEVNGKTVAVLTFTGPDIVGGSLADGNYTLTVHADRVLDSLGQGLEADHVTEFFRLFGDSDGDGDVDGRDLVRFRRSLGTQQGQSGFVDYFDYDGDGDVDFRDLLAFRDRMGTSL